MIYTHVLAVAGGSIGNPLDDLLVATESAMQTKVPPP
jgi:hypothetical protein